MAGGMFASHYESGGDIIEVNGKLFKQFYGTYTVVYVSSTIIYWYLELLFLSNPPISIRTALSKLCPLFWPNLPLLVLYLYILDQALHFSVLTIQCTLRFPYWLSLSVSCTSFDRHVIWCRDGKAFRGSGRIQVKRGQSSHASLQRSDKNNTQRYSWWNSIKLHVRWSEVRALLVNVIWYFVSLCSIIATIIIWYQVIFTHNIGFNKQPKKILSHFSSVNWKNFRREQRLSEWLSRSTRSMGLSTRRKVMCLFLSRRVSLWWTQKGREKINLLWHCLDFTFFKPVHWMLSTYVAIHELSWRGERIRPVGFYWFKTHSATLEVSPV